MGAVFFGSAEELTCITDVALRGAEHEPLCLAYKTTTTFFLAGVSMSDDGYELKIKGGEGSYYPMPTGSELQEMQAAGVLPKVMPHYELSTAEYAKGYGLWIIIGAFVLVNVLTSLGGRLRRAKPSQVEWS